MRAAVRAMRDQVDGPWEPSHLYWDGRSVTSASSATGPGCTQAVHAEQNAISFAARWGVELEGAQAVVTHQPCLSCAMSIINSGIKSVTYVHPYRLRDGLELLLSAGIEVRETLAPNGID
jgi:deoxycytidylate deaminase